MSWVIPVLTLGSSILSKMSSGKKKPVAAMNSAAGLPTTLSELRSRAIPTRYDHGPSNEYNQEIVQQLKSLRDQFTRMEGELGDIKRMISHRASAPPQNNLYPQLVPGNHQNNVGRAQTYLP